MACTYPTKARTILDEGIRIGLDQGLEQGREQGLEQGREQGIALGIEQGVQMALESLVAKGWITQEQADEQLQVEKSGRSEPIEKG